MGQLDDINVVATTGSRQGRRPAGHRPRPPAGGRGGHRPDGAQRADELHQPVAFVFLHRAAGVRVHLAVRRRLHHLQHVLDHRRAADAGAGPAAGRRRQPRPGVPLRARGGRHCGRCFLAHRYRAGRAGRRRARGAAQRVRLHAAVGTARVRGPHRLRRPGRRRRRDGHRRHQPGPPGRAHPSRRRHHRPRPEPARSRPGAGSPGAAPSPSSVASCSPSGFPYPPSPS